MNIFLTVIVLPLPIVVADFKAYFLFNFRLCGLNETCES